VSTSTLRNIFTFMTGLDLANMLSFLFKMNSILQPKPKPKLVFSREEYFKPLYLAAFTGLHAQFTRTIWADADCKAYLTCADIGEKPERSRQFARTALNSANAACQVFELQPSPENENFMPAYLAAFTGLHAQFTHSMWDYDGRGDFDFKQMDNEDKSPTRSKTIAQVAYNSANDACAIFEVQTFNEKLAAKK
jgi:hypothetical protein